MRPRFNIEIAWERLEHGPREERAAYGAIGLRVGNDLLTEAHDTFVGRVRQAVHLSGYLLAQWLAWNWWRLLWEPEGSPLSLTWKMAHKLTTLGGGYVWPNVTCTSDGARMLLQATPTPTRANEPLRYVANVRQAISVHEFEAGAAEFIERVLEKLRSEGVHESNLAHIWRDVCEERRDDEASWYRHLEATMGFDPGEGNASFIDGLIADEKPLGRLGVAELASVASTPVRANDLEALASTLGFDAQLTTDIPSSQELATTTEDTHDEASASHPAWIVGETAANALRARESLDGNPLTDKALAALAGTNVAVLRDDRGDAPFSFALGTPHQNTKIVMKKSSYRTNRRFELARMIGDRILERDNEPLVPILRSYTYRQKRQRAFAAQLLCPFEHVTEELQRDDHSEEIQERIATRYGVSPMLVRTQLVNHELVDRETLGSF